MWIILFTRLDQYGVRELRDSRATPEQVMNAKRLLRIIYQEGLAAAVRISGLVSFSSFDNWFSPIPSRPELWQMPNISS
jgi:hypothetical protein